MRDFFQRIVTRWISRRATPDAEALQAIAGLVPAIVVTGASRGIGLALADRFAAAGHAIVLVARHPGPLAEAAEKIRQTTAAAHVVTLALDVTDARAFDQITATLTAHGLYLDVLINSAGQGLAGAFATQKAEELDHLLALNAAALTRLMRLALPHMLARARGGILNVASLGGYVPGPYQAAYYASKSYVIALSEAVAEECAGRGVRFTVLAPGPVETSFHAAMGADHALYRAVMPALSPERVAAAGYHGFMLGRRVVVPGLFGLVVMALTRLTPHAVSVPITGWLLWPRSGRR